MHRLAVLLNISISLSGARAGEYSLQAYTARYDFLVYGATASGVMAAIASVSLFSYKNQ